MKQVKTLRDLRDAVRNRKAVLCPECHCWARPRAAAFMINLQGYILVKLLDRGMYVYESGGKNENYWCNKKGEKK